MSKANSVRMRSGKYKIPTASNLAHNSAMTKATYWLNDGSDIEQSHKYNDFQKLNEDWNGWAKENEERYLQRHNRKLRSDGARIEEGLISFGKDVDLTQNEIKQITQEYLAKFEKDNNTTVRHWAIHTHEGHKEFDTGEEKLNRHVHFLYDNVNKDGLVIRRNFKESDLKQMQDYIYEISKKYDKDIRRGTPAEISGKKHQHHRVYRNKREKEQLKNKDQEQFAKQKDLKEEIQKLREALKKQQATRQDYAKLEQFNKELKEQLKMKELTIEKMKESINSYKEAQNSPKLDLNKKSIEITSEIISEAKNRNKAILEENIESNMLGKKSIPIDKVKKIQNEQDKNIFEASKKIVAIAHAQARVEIKKEYEAKVSKLQAIALRLEQERNILKDRLNEIYRTLHEKLGMEYSKLGDNFQKFKDFFKRQEKNANQQERSNEQNRTEQREKAKERAEEQANKNKQIRRNR